MSFSDVFSTRAAYFKQALPFLGWLRYRYGFTKAIQRACDIRPMSSDLVTIRVEEPLVAARAQQLQQLELLEESPWDGLQRLGVELSVHRSGVRGLKRLWSVCAASQLSEELWQGAVASASPMEALKSLGAAPQPGVYALRSAFKNME